MCETRFKEGTPVLYISPSGVTQRGIIIETFFDLFDIPRCKLVTTTDGRYPKDSVIVVNRKNVILREIK